MLGRERRGQLMVAIRRKHGLTNFSQGVPSRLEASAAERIQPNDMALDVDLGRASTSPQLKRRRVKTNPHGVDQRKRRRQSLNISVRVASRE
jgi:hypothetical protein